MKTRLFPSVCFTAAALCCSLPVPGAAESTQTIKFSDSSKPGTVKISLGRGDLRIKGVEGTEVTLKSDTQPVETKRKDGMRVLSSSSSFSLTETNNVIRIDSGKDLRGRSNSDFELLVPRNTSIIVQNAWGGSITCTSINGDIEINSMQGEIRLDDVAGGVVVGTMNGEIQANIRELNEGKPLSFTSMNGEVVVRVPESAKATVRLRTHNGTVLTDFPESALITKTEAAPGWPGGKMQFGPRSKELSAEIQDAIREATQFSATAVREALEAVKEGLEAARLGSDEARQQMDDARRQIDRARRDFERQKADTVRQAAARARSGEAPSGEPPAAPAAPAMPRVPAKPMPTISGGKLVTGSLNGGGPEISVSTMNGDVILQKLETK